MRLQKKTAAGIGACLILAVMAVMLGERAYVRTNGSAAKVKDERPCVVIDAGHGGSDPGKIGSGGVREKDLNLEIALLLAKYLEADDVRVVLTRETGESLADVSTSNRKVQDMKRRIAVIEEAGPVATVSIHQNSYPEEYVHGAQVFYYTGSAEGQRLAQRIQDRIVKGVDPDNRRQIKANSSYYLLKKTRSTIVIVECGFLSNREETEKLCTKEYQEKLAWEIHLGILQYIKEAD